MARVEAMAWSPGYLRLKAAIRSELENTGLPWGAAAAVVYLRWREKYASATVAGRVRAIKSLAWEGGWQAEARPVVRASAKWDGAVAAPPGTAVGVADILEKIRRDKSPAATAVLVALSAGGARYASIVRLRQGDVEVGLITLRSEKRARGLAPRRFPWPATPWIRGRLRGLVAPAPAATPWAMRPVIFECSERDMSKVVGARTLRRAVSKAAVEAVGEKAAAAIVGHTENTMRSFYMGGAPAVARGWAAALSSAA